MPIKIGSGKEVVADNILLFSTGSASLHERNYRIHGEHSSYVSMSNITSLMLYSIYAFSYEWLSRLNGKTGLLCLSFLSRWVFSKHEL